ncbi:MAG: response regulator transcription factor [Gammaproteobacteria bacterium]|nr:response regulator transcription factor [Gammaproteobacteria bacterium]
MRILLVEDDLPLSRQIKTALQKEGFAVDQVDNGIDAEFMGTEEPYDAIILDLGLPQRPGIEVLRNWRTQGNKAPVIILTARDAWHEKVDGFKAGADDYLAKPFHIEELVARLNALIKRSQTQDMGTLQVAGLKLDEAHQCVENKDGVRFELTGTEFRLLRYMMMHPGVILSKAHLTEHVYEYDTDRDSNVIEVYIKRLRNKVGNDLIKTKRGQGYILNKTG